MSYINIIREALNLFLSNPAWDTLLLLFLFFSVFVYGLMVGRNRIIVLLLASYPAALINEYIPYPRNFLANLNIAQSIFLKSFGFFMNAALSSAKLLLTLCSARILWTLRKKISRGALLRLASLAGPCARSRPMISTVFLR